MSDQVSYSTNITRDRILNLSTKVVNSDNGFNTGDDIKIEIRIDPEGNVVWRKETQLPDHMKIRIPRNLYLIDPSREIYVTVSKKQKEE